MRGMRKSYQAEVTAFKRQLIETTLREFNGNRTHAADALGLPRTYLLRLMRQLAVDAPPSLYRAEKRRRTRAYRSGE